MKWAKKGRVKANTCAPDPPQSPIFPNVGNLVRKMDSYLTTTAWLSRGLPRQFSVMWQNILCSILFHLLVPGGKWHTVIFKCNSPARS